MKFRHAPSWALAMLFVLLALGAARAADLVRTGIPADDDFHFSMLQVGQSAGIWAKNGIALKILDFRGSGPMHQAMVAGSLDMALGAGTDFAFMAKGAPEKGVGVLSTVPTNFVMEASTQSGITTVAGLKGKRIGVSSSASLTYWLAVKLSLDQGWGKNGVVIVATGGPEGTNAGLTAGTIDGSVSSLEQGLRLQNDGRVRVLNNFGDIIHPFVTHVIFATDDMMKNHADVTRRFLKAWYETIAFANSHKAETIRYSQPVTELNDKIASDVYDIEMKTFSTNGRFDSKGVAAVKQTMMDLGAVKTPPASSVLYTDAFLPQ